MKKNKLSAEIIFAITLIMLNSFIVSAAEPALPTSIYGKVLHSNGELAIGVDVTVTWTDADNAQRTTSTKTLTNEQADKLGDRSLVGAYLFNEGYVKAKLNSEIKIMINGVEFEKISSNPGGIVKVRDAILSLQGQSSGSGATAQGSASGTGQGTASTPSDSATSGSSGSDGSSASGSASGTGTANGNNDFSSSDSSASSSSGDTGSRNYFPVPSSDSSTTYSETKSNPTLPTNFFGQLVDEDGKPVESEEVSAEWIDEQGNKHTTATRTLTKKEAKALGNKNLQGFYAFNRGDIKAKPNSTINVKTRNITKEVVSNPGKTSEVEKVQLFAGPDKKETMSILNKIINKTSGVIIEENKQNKTKISLLLLPLILGVILLTFYILKYKKKARKKIPVEYPLYKEMSSKMDIKIKNIMTENVTTITKGDTLNEALRLMFAENRNCLVVVSGKKPIGVVSEDDFLKLFTKPDADINKLKVRDIMPDTLVTAPSNLTVSECIKLIFKNKTRKIPVIKNDKLVGIITITDLLRYFDKFFSRNIIDPFNVPSVRNVMSSEVIKASPDYNLLELCDYLVKKKMDYSLVNGNELGIITTKDILDQFYKNPNSLRKLKVVHLMRTLVISITPGKSIFEANKMMIEKNFRRLPVIANNEVVGVLNHLDTLWSIYSFFDDLKVKIEHNKK